MMKVEVSGGEKRFARARRRSPMKLRGGPGSTGRILPAKPMRMKMDPMTITTISNMV
jgi:hypothetical protein